MQHLARHIHYTLKKSEKTIIIPHREADADALGAATALYEYLANAGKPAAIFCATPISQRLQFLPHYNAVTANPNIFTASNITAIVVVDSGDLRYAGVDKHLANHPATIVNIDHHATNEHYGHLNLVIPTASSTSEILFHFFKHNHLPINQRMATSLLAGLLTDTGHFTNAATSATALAIAGELLRAGGQYQLVTDWTVRNKPVAALRLWGVVFSRLTKFEPLNLAYTYLTRNDLSKYGVDDAESEGIANFLNNLDNTDIALILRETEDGQVKGSLRTTKDTVDVAALAQKLGGGGHKKAAGFTLAGTIDEVLQKILTLESA